MKLIVGLGNPGKRYEKTRHNIGFVVIEAVREELSKSGQVGAWELSKKFNAEICGGTMHGMKFLLAKPMTFMNSSGQAVGLIMHFYKILPKDLLVVHDDKDLPLGGIRVQTNRGHAGHNGVRSIMEHIGTQDFTRLRLGIAKKEDETQKDVADFVLSKFGLTERKTVREMKEGACAILIEHLDLQ